MSGGAGASRGPTGTARAARAPVSVAGEEDPDMLTNAPFTTTLPVTGGNIRIHEACGRRSP